MIIKKFRLSDDDEFDITVIEQKEWTSNVFEVKHLNRPVPEQARHLLNKEQKKEKDREFSGARVTKLSISLNSPNLEVSSADTITVKSDRF